MFPLTILVLTLALLGRLAGVLAHFVTSRAESPRRLRRFQAVGMIVGTLIAAFLIYA